MRNIQSIALNAVREAIKLEGRDATVETLEMRAFEQVHDLSLFTHHQKQELLKTIRLDIARMKRKANPQ